MSLRDDGAAKAAGASNAEEKGTRSAASRPGRSLVQSGPSDAVEKAEAALSGSPKQAGYQFQTKDKSEAQVDNYTKHALDSHGKNSACAKPFPAVSAASSKVVLPQLQAVSTPSTSVNVPSLSPSQRRSIAVSPQPSALSHPTTGQGLTLLENSPVSSPFALNAGQKPQPISRSGIAEPALPRSHQSSLSSGSGHVLAPHTKIRSPESTLHAGGPSFRTLRLKSPAYSPTSYDRDSGGNATQNLADTALNASTDDPTADGGPDDDTSSLDSSVYSAYSASSLGSRSGTVPIWNSSRQQSQSSSTGYTGSTSRSSSLDGGPGGDNRKRKRSSRSLHIGFEDKSQSVGAQAKGSCSIDIECANVRHSSGLWVMKDFADALVRVAQVRDRGKKDFSGSSRQTASQTALERMVTSIVDNNWESHTPKDTSGRKNSREIGGKALRKKRTKELNIAKEDSTAYDIQAHTEKNTSDAVEEKLDSGAPIAVEERPTAQISQLSAAVTEPESQCPPQKQPQCDNTTATTRKISQITSNSGSIPSSRHDSNVSEHPEKTIDSQSQADSLCLHSDVMIQPAGVKKEALPLKSNTGTSKDDENAHRPTAAASPRYSRNILHCVKTYGFAKPTKLQAHAVPAVLSVMLSRSDGKSCVVVQGPAGTGKTAGLAFALSVGIDPRVAGLQAIVLCLSDRRDFEKFFHVFTLLAPDVQLYSVFQKNCSVGQAKNAEHNLTSDPDNLIPFSADDVGSLGHSFEASQSQGPKVKLERAQVLVGDPQSVLELFEQHTQLKLDHIGAVIIDDAQRLIANPSSESPQSERDTMAKAFAAPASSVKRNNEESLSPARSVDVSATANTPKRSFDETLTVVSEKQSSVSLNFPSTKLMERSSPEHELLDRIIKISTLVEQRASVSSESTSGTAANNSRLRYVLLSQLMGRNNGSRRVLRVLKSSVVKNKEREIQALAQQVLAMPTKIRPNVKHYTVEAPREHWVATLKALVNALLFPRAIVFCDEAKNFDYYPVKMKECSMAVCINNSDEHASKTSQKTQGIQRFIASKSQFFYTMSEPTVCQSALPKVSCVFHFDVPADMPALYAARLQPLDGSTMRDVVSVLFVEKAGCKVITEIIKLYGISFMEMPCEFIPKGT